MRKYFYLSFLSILFFSGFESIAQPTFSQLTVNATNTQATVVFSQPVGSNAGVNQALTASEFTVGISASLNGGTVAANANVTVTVSHTANTNTATLSFTIPNASTADGSEVLTVQPSGANKIYSASGAMVNTASIPANLKDLLAPNNQNTIFPTSVVKKGGAAVTIVAGNATDFNWLAPSGTSSFTANGTTITTAAGNATSITAPSNAGTYKLYVLDAAGNKSAESTATLTVDNTAPTVVLTDDHADAIVRDADNVVITATFTEANGIDETTVPKITIGSLVTNANMTKTSNLVWTYTWDVPTGNDGSVAVSISATDVAGNANTAATAGVGGTTSYTIDNTVPTVVLTDDHPDNIVSDADNVVITATFTEANAIDETTVPKISIGTVVTNASMTKSSNLVWTYNWNVPSGNDGNAAITITATDVAGNPNTAATAGVGGATDFTIDNTGPTAPGTPTAAVGPNINASENGTFSVDVSGINTTGAVAGDILEILVNGSSFSSPRTQVLTAGDIASGYTFTNVTLPGPDGLKNITARITDQIGNQGALSGQLALTLDVTPPTLLIGAPSLSITNTGPVTFSVTYSGASSVNLTTGNITLNTTGTANGTVSVTNGTTNNPTVTISGITGDGTLGITIAAATASDAAGNTTAGAVSSTFAVDNTPPAPLAAAPDLTTATDTEGISGTGTGTTSDNITKSTNPTFTGSGVNGTTVKIYSSILGEIGSGVVSGGTYTIGVGNIAEGTHGITARVMDGAGNLSTPTPSFNVIIDRTPPQIVLKKWIADGPAGNKEEMIITFTELLDMSNGLLIANSDGDATKHGFSSSSGGVKDSDSKFFSSYTSSSVTYNNVIVLRSLNNGDWPDANVQIRYRDVATSPTNATGNHPNYVYDLAGNELFTINFNGSDSDAPVLSSGFVLIPDGLNPEKITFTVNETLSQGATVNGFSVDGVAVTGAYSGNTITLTAPLDGTWDNSAQVSYIPGNVKDNSNNFMVAIPNTPIRIQDILITSNNANGFTQQAKPGDVLTVNFVTSTAPSATPVVKIDNANATVSGAHPNWTATYATSGANSTGTLSFFMYMLTAADSTATTSTTLPLPVSSSIVFDKTAPTITPITITSNNPNPAYGRPGDLVTLSFTVSESLFTTPTVTIGGVSATVSNIGLNYTASVTLTNAFTEGVLPIAISVQDIVGNVTNASATTNASSITFDKTAPTVSSITVNNTIVNAYASAINGTTPSLNGNQVDFLVTFNEPVNGVTFSTLSTQILPALGTLQFPTVSATPFSVSPVTSGGAASTAPSQYWKVVYNNVSGSGTLRLDVVNNFTVTDRASLALSGATTTGPAYNISLPQPTSAVGALSTSSGTNSITVNWADVSGATNYLVVVTTANSPTIADGTFVANDTNFGDGTVTQNVAQGVQSAAFTGLTTSAYNVFVIPYALSPNNTNNTVIDYFSASPATVSRASDIIRDTGFSYPQNIDYKTLQATDIPTGSGTGSVVLERFIVRDGSTDIDALGTTLSSITLDITNYQNLRQLALYDGTTEIRELAVSGANITVINATTARMTFSGLAPFTATDGSTKTLSIRGSFNAGGVTDNQVISFSVFNVAAGSSGSQFINIAPSGIQSSPSGDDNKIEVTASTLFFSTPATASIVSLNSPFVVVAEARDVNSNIDLDFAGAGKAITALTNASSATMASTPAVVGGQFTSGSYTFPSDFRFTSGNNNDNVTLTLTAGGLSGVSPTLTLLASLESSIVGDPTFTFTANIAYETFPESTDLTDANSFLLARALLVDGSRTNFNYTSTFGSGNLTTNTETDFIVNQDQDLAPTTLNSLTIRVTNPSNIRRIALFTNSGTQIGSEIAVSVLKTDLISSQDFVFSGSPLLTANDNSTAEIRVRVSFWNDDAHITDNNLIQVSIVDAVAGAGSKFFNSPPYIAGVNGGLTAPTSVNLIEVTATSLDFVNPMPSAYAGINEPIDGSSGASPGGQTGLVHARDKFGVIDTDFNFSATVTAAATPISYPTNFTAGVLNLAGMQYRNAGDGTLTVVANGINSNNEPWATSKKCPTVDVINVTALLPQNPANGVIGTTSLKGGTTNQVIFGFDIYPEHVTATEPELKEFYIKFSNPYKTASTTIFKNFKVYESTNGVFTGSSLVTTVVPGTTVTEEQSPELILAAAPSTTKDIVKVTFPGGSYRTLKDKNQSSPITYFLLVDIDATANNATPTMKPFLVDKGYGTNSNNSILTTIGSSSASVEGTEFKFASNRPPALVKTVPGNGELNVDSLLTEIKLYFDVPVWSHDKQILIWKRSDNTLVGKLPLKGIIGDYYGGGTVAGSGPKSDPKATPPVPLTFEIPTGVKLYPDSVYYITIAKGTFNTTTKTGTGISDDAFNLYPGISYSGDFFFKIASKNPPLMLSTQSSKYYPSATGATINASFDQRDGKAYYMVVNQGDPAPTNAMIEGSVAYPVTPVFRGSFDISKIHPDLNTATFNVLPSGSPRTFDVWIYAESGAPIPVKTSAPYGRLNNDLDLTNDYVPGATGPTFQVTIPKQTNTVYINTPIYNICTDSAVVLSDPIIIEESSAQNEFADTFVSAGNFVIGNTYIIFFAGTTNFTAIGARDNLPGTVFVATGAGSGTGIAYPVQTFNILLPSGYTFDESTKPSIETNNGVDFFGAISSSFVNSTLLRISFANRNASSQDKLIISNLKVRASIAGLQGEIKRFAGTAFSSSAALKDGTVLARINSANPDGYNFTNTYTLENKKFFEDELNITNTVTVIPNNYVSADQSLSNFSVRLIPSTGTDYGYSTFTGNGVTDDILSLSAINNLNTAFNITLNHTDLNGCPSSNAEQYEVYNNVDAIPQLTVDTLYTKKGYAINPNYLTGGLPPAFTTPADTTIAIDYRYKAGYQLIDLIARIPASATKLDTLSTGLLDRKSVTDQIIFGTVGSDWDNLVRIIPVLKDSTATDPNLNESYKSFYWDYNVLLSGPSSIDPYKFFDAKTPTARRTFYTGGSIGIVEFTGAFRSLADTDIKIPIKQEIEIFIPPIPVVEVEANEITSYDKNDPLRPDVKLWPQGTPIFCQGGVPFTINGYPKATPGISIGSFDIVDAANPTDTLYSSKNPAKRYNGFVDNGNGTAILTPSAFKNPVTNRFANEYKNIRVIYTYKDNASPISGASDLIIRISPNPTPSFSNASIMLSDNNAAFDKTKLNGLLDGRPANAGAFCEDNYILFTNTTQFLDQDGNTVAGYRSVRRPAWTMGDPSKSGNIKAILDPNDTTSTEIDTVVFKYNNPGNYQVQFSIESQFGCPSGVYSKTISVGDIPEAPYFSMTGISTTTPIVTTNELAGTTAEWNFGNPYQSDLDLMTFGTVNTNTYSTPDHYTITMKATTTVGCEIGVQRKAIIVPSVVVPVGTIQVNDDFESADPLKQWQTSDTSRIIASWERGIIGTTKKDSLKLTTNVWVTGLDNFYNKEEESYLYSPVYNLSTLARPMVSFDQSSYLANNDGVVLEFSVDNLNVADPLKKWYRLGISGEGKNWYDKAGLASKPGSQLKYDEIISSGDYGWSRKDTVILSSRHALSPDLPSTNQVVFRFALQSVDDRIGSYGFALDNFRIGDRTRTVLVENFTNKGTSNAAEEQQSDFLKGFDGAGTVGTDVVKVNYHVGFPGEDPLNKVNEADPSGRALYYGVSKTPYAVMDGLYSDPSNPFSAWADLSYGERSLELAGATLNVTQNFVNGNFEVIASVKAEKDLPASTVLHVAFLEQLITTTTGIQTNESTFEYVLKKMLPSASGTRFNQMLTAGSVKNFDKVTWAPDSKKLFNPTNDLVLVVFLQDEITKEVHQVEFISGIADPPVITGIKDLLPEQVSAYPNPAKREFKVELPAVTQTDVELTLIDQVGRVHKAGKISSGNNSATVNVEHLAEGIYILQIGNDSSGLIRKKMMIVQGN